MDIFEILAIVISFVCAWYFFKGIASLVKKDGYVKKNFSLMGGAFILFAIFISMTEVTEDLVVDNNTKKMDAKDEDKAKLAQEKLYNETLTSFVSGNTQNEYLSYTGSFLNYQDDLYISSSFLGGKSYYGQKDVRDKEVMDRKDLLHVLDNYDFKESKPTDFKVINKLKELGGKSSSFRVSKNDKIIPISTWWSNGLLLQDKDHYFYMKIEDLDIKDNRFVEDLFRGTMGNSSGKATMKWYKKMQDTLKNPLYYYANGSNSSLKSVVLTKKIDDYSLTLNAIYSPDLNKKFNESFIYNLQINDASYTDYLEALSKSNKFNRVILSEKESNKLIDLATQKQQAVKESSNAMENESTIVNTSPEDKETVIEELVGQYLDIYTSGNTDLLSKVVDENSSFHTQQTNYMNSLISRGITLSLDYYHIATINSLEDDVYEVKVDEDYMINNHNEHKVVLQTSVYQVKKFDGVFKIVGLTTK